jgi:putative peptidoglycan lipid II flippase
VTLAAAILAGVAYLVWDGLDQVLGRSTLAQLVSVGGGLLAGAGAYFGSVLALRVPEARQIVRLVRRI